jgi:hypothetical protein
MDPLYVKGLREAKGLLDAGTISAEDFEKETLKLCVVVNEGRGHRAAAHGPSHGLSRAAARPFVTQTGCLIRI